MSTLPWRIRNRGPKVALFWQITVPGKPHSPVVATIGRHRNTAKCAKSDKSAMGPIAGVYVVDGLPPGQEGTTTLVYAQSRGVRCHSWSDPQNRTGLHWAAWL